MLVRGGGSQGYLNVRTLRRQTRAAKGFLINTLKTRLRQELSGSVVESVDSPPLMISGLAGVR